MNQKTFFETLATINRGRHKFEISGGEEIRQRRTDRCPICAVAKRVTKKAFDNADYDTAGRELGLKNVFVDSVAYAADCNPSTAIGEFRYKKQAIRARNQLLKTLSLSNREGGDN